LAFGVRRSPFTVHCSPFAVHRSAVTVWRSELGVPGSASGPGKAMFGGVRILSEATFGKTLAVPGVRRRRKIAPERGPSLRSNYVREGLGLSDPGLLFPLDFECNNLAFPDQQRDFELRGTESVESPARNSRRACNSRSKIRTCPGSPPIRIGNRPESESRFAFRALPFKVNPVRRQKYLFGLAGRVASLRRPPSRAEPRKSKQRILSNMRGRYEDRSHVDSILDVEHKQEQERTGACIAHKSLRICERCRLHAVWICAGCLLSPVEDKPAAIACAYLPELHPLCALPPTIRVRRGRPGFQSDRPRTCLRQAFVPWPPPPGPL
jgi:hypothetical protein